MRVVVTGGRGFADSAFVSAILDALHERRAITSIIHGCANGAEALADYWASLRNIPTEVFIADWQKHGRAADAIRNAEMIATKPDLCVLFPGGKGTAIFKIQAEAAGLKLFQPAYRGVQQTVPPWTPGQPQPQAETQAEDFSPITFRR